MAQRTILVVLAAGIAFGFTACKDDPKKAAAEKLALERAKKKESAIKNYKTLVDKYPNAAQTEKAKERLRTLGPVATPKKK